VPSDQYVTVGNAATATGVSERTLRYWIKSGKLPATGGKRGRLVRLADVEALADFTGNTPATSGNLAGSAVTTAGNTDNGNPDTLTAGNATAIASDQGRQQLAVIRDTLLAPLIAQNDRLVTQVTEQAETIGHLRAERDELRAQLEALQAPTRDENNQEDTQDAGYVYREPEPTTSRPWWKVWRRG
jgi:excisionase family DNA binding protein